MRNLGSVLKKYWLLTVVFCLLSALYVAQTVTSAPSAEVLNKYHLSTGAFHVLSLTIALPYITIWLISLVGYIRLRYYTFLLGDGKDGPGFRTLSKGVLLVTLWLPIITVLTNIASNYYDIHPDWTANLTRVLSYINVLLLLIGFLLIKRGAEQLVAITDAKWAGMSQRQTALFIAASAVYVFLMFDDSTRQAVSGISTSVYYEPDWLVLLTIVVPRLVTWYFGLSAACSMILYSRKVKGAFYRKAIARVAYGIGGITMAVVTLRVVQSLAAKLNDSSLIVLLAVIYVLLLVMGVGYGLLASGAKHLQKIEES